MIEFCAGTVIDDRFEVLECSGGGGIGTVYRVRDLEEGVEAALKILHQFMNKEDVRRRFLREFQVLSQIRHPRVVRTRAWGVWEGRPYF